jgi:hypothetical protein
LYTFSENNNIALTTTTSIVTGIINQPTIPSTTIRNTKNVSQSYFGYQNINEFPLPYVPDCSLQSIVLPSNYMIVEDPTQYGALSSEDVPIKTEVDAFIIP